MATFVSISGHLLAQSESILHEQLAYYNMQFNEVKGQVNTSMWTPLPAPTSVREIPT